MKKLFAIMCAATLLSLAACHKDKNETTTPAQEEPQREGVYNPQAKISAIHYSDSTPDEMWQWEGNQLMTVSTLDESGYAEPTTEFVYSNGRVSNIYTTLMGISAEVGLTYGSDKLIHTAPIHVMGMDATTVQVHHNGQKKVDKLSFNLNNDMLNAVVQLIMQFLNSDDSNGNILPFLHPAPANKLTIDSNQFSIDVLWAGENATRALINARINMTTTLNELPRELLNSMLDSNIVSIALTLMGDNPLPVQLALTDTIDYTYDNKNNPMKGYLGAVDIAALSANNVESKTTSGAATITANINIPYVGSYPLSYDYPLNASSTSYSFQYNNNGYPSRKTDQDGNITEYTYLGN